MPGTVTLGRIAHVPIGLHYSWFFIAALIALSLAAHFRALGVDWSPTLIWSVSFFTALLFFITLLLHELAHAVVARRRGLPVHSITLFALGGVASIPKEATTARTEFLVAVVGPLASVVIGLMCIGLARLQGWSPNAEDVGIAGSVLGWLGSINLLLAAFNLLPAYPLDGGRVLRALLWGVQHDVVRATRQAARVGQVFAALLIGWGVFQFVFGAGFGGLWLALIGWFLMGAAQASYRQVTLNETLRGITAGDVMSHDCATVNADVMLQRLVDELVLRRGRRCILVEHEGHVAGVVTPREIRNVARPRWSDVTVGEIMTPIEEMPSVAPDTTVADALDVMTQHKVGELPVVVDGRVEGTVTRNDIQQVIESWAELKAA